MTFFITLLVMVVILIFAKLTLGRSNRDEELKNAIEHMNTRQKTDSTESVSHSPVEKEEENPYLYTPSHKLTKVMKESSFDGFSLTLLENDLDENYMAVDLKGLYYRSEAEQERARKLLDKERVVLVKEPENPKDPYAIRIETMDGVTIGYIPEFLSEKLSRNFDYLEPNESYVHVKNDDAIPSIKVYFLVLGKSGFYWDKYLMAGQTHHEYRDRYPELQQNLYVMADENPEKVADIWGGLYSAHPDDPYLEFKYMEALDRIGEYEHVIELATDLREKLNLWAFGRVEHFISRAKRKLRERHDIEISQKFANQYEEGCNLMKKKEYEAALDKLLPCMKGTYRVQALPKNICKCYEKLKRNEEGIAFATDAIQKNWLTEYTIVALQKYIAKYSAS